MFEGLPIKPLCLLAIPLLVLTACAKPQTIGPKASRTEIMAEGQLQEQYAQASRDKQKSASADNLSIASRVKDTANRIIPAAANLCADLGSENPTECIYDIHVTAPKEGEKDQLNAYADGQKIVLTNAMVNFASDNSELAFIMAHEYAHNFMKHQKASMQNTLIGGLLGTIADIATAGAGYNSGGQFGKLGMQGGRLAYSPSFENEADYIALYLLARAGYTYDHVPEFWRRMSGQNPNSIYLRSTHPSNAERYVVMRKTISEIQQKQAKKLPLIPEFIKRK